MALPRAVAEPALPQLRFSINSFYGQPPFSLNFLTGFETDSLQTQETHGESYSCNHRSIQVFWQAKRINSKLE